MRERVELQGSWSIIGIALPTRGEMVVRPAYQTEHACGIVVI